MIRGFLAFHWSVGMHPSGTGSRNTKINEYVDCHCPNLEIIKLKTVPTPGVPVINEVKGVSVMARPCK